jgi:dienelactone hydrolase
MAAELSGGTTRRGHRAARRRTGVAAMLAAATALALGVQATHQLPGAGAGTALPEDPGPYAVHVTTASIPVPRSVIPPDPEGLFTAVIADVYVPQGAGPFPLLQLSHAWPDTRRNMAGWGTILASRGMVVVISDRRTQSALDLAPAPVSTAGEAGLDQLADAIDLTADVNAEDVLRVVRWAVAQDSVRGSMLSGKVDARRIAIAGHSLGGYYATFAADRASREGPKLAALLLLDPTDERLGTTSSPTRSLPIGWSSLHVAPTLQLPAAVLASEENMHPVKCNMADGPDCTIVSEQEYAALTSARARFGLKVAGSVHGDPEIANATTRTAHQLLFQRYGIAWLEYWLEQACGLATYLGGAAALADEAAGRIALFPGEVFPPVCGA